MPRPRLRPTHGCLLARAVTDGGRSPSRTSVAGQKRDFDAARAKAPCVVFTDEIDSFADRSKIRHAYADYVIEVVNGFIAQLDGAAGREGLIFLAASHDVSRCDSAILRSGRLNRVLRIGLPNAQDLERMFRVRLAGRLAGDDLEEICLLALG